MERKFVIPEEYEKKNGVIRLNAEDETV